MTSIGSTLVEVAVAAGGFGAVIIPAISWVGRRNETHRQTATAAAITTAVTEAKTEITTQVSGAVKKLQEDTTRRFDANDRASEKAAEKAEAAVTRLTRIEAQFGSNGGGLREKVDGVGEDVAALVASGEVRDKRFEDHLKQAADDRNRLGRVESALLGKGAQQ